MGGRLLTAALLLSLGLTACSGSEEPEAGPTLPPVTGAPRPTAEPDAVPSAATAATPEGAAEFARFFADEVHQAYLQKDPERIERLSAPGCTACKAYVASINEIKRLKASISDSYTVEVLDAQAPAVAPDATDARVTVLLRIGELVLTAPDGEEIHREPASEEAVQEITLERSDGSWRTAEVTRD